MIRIYICDDSRDDIDRLKNEIEKYEMEKRTQLEIKHFLRPEHLIYELQENNPADIFILDVSMPEKNGFELAREIRLLNEKALIIFLTSLENRATEGYKAKAHRYIVKMNLERDLPEALDSAVEEISKNDDKVIVLHKYNDYWRIYHSDIICVVRQARRLVVTTATHGELTDSRGITEFYNLLDDDRFLFIDRGCFVNVDYITGLTDSDIKMKNGEVLAVSRRCLQKVRQVLLDRWGL